MNASQCYAIRTLSCLKLNRPENVQLEKCKICVSLVWIHTAEDRSDDGLL